jgi:hypothetical protein
MYLLASVGLLLILFAVAELLVNVLIDQVSLFGVVAQVLEVMVDFGMGLRFYGISITVRMGDLPR